VSLRRPRPSPCPHPGRPAAAAAGSLRGEEDSSHMGPREGFIKVQARAARSHAASNASSAVAAGYAAETVDQSDASAAAGGGSPGKGSKPFLKRRSHTIVGTRVDWSHVKPRTVTRSAMRAEAAIDIVLHLLFLLS
jgi:hypothetical protein